MNSRLARFFFLEDIISCLFVVVARLLVIAILFDLLDLLEPLTAQTADNTTLFKYTSQTPPTAVQLRAINNASYRVYNSRFTIFKESVLNSVRDSILKLRGRRHRLEGGCVFFVLPNSTTDWESATRLASFYSGLLRDHMHALILIQVVYAQNNVTKNDNQQTK